MTDTQDTWPAGATWVFQGTIAEDATAGTHVCTLTVTPGAGNEIQVLYGLIQVGATATAQVVRESINDGTNLVGEWIAGLSCTTTSARFYFPPNGPPAATGSTLGPIMPTTVSGAQQLILQVSTAAVSVTQTFAVVCRIKGAMPTAVLLDTIGTSTNTVNTNKVF